MDFPRRVWQVGQAQAGGFDASCGYGSKRLGHRHRHSAIWAFAMCLETRRKAYGPDIFGLVEHE
jgi:hypothetical protein